MSKTKQVGHLPTVYNAHLEVQCIERSGKKELMGRPLEPFLACSQGPSPANSFRRTQVHTHSGAQMQRSNSQWRDTATQKTHTHTLTRTDTRGRSQRHARTHAHKHRQRLAVLRSCPEKGTFAWSMPQPWPERVVATGRRPK